MFSIKPSDAEGRTVKVPFSWKVPGWFMVGWSAEFPVGEANPLRYIPDQPDRPNRALRLRVFPVTEQCDCAFVWHQPQGKEPQWEMPDIFTSFPQFETDPSAYYRPCPEFSRRTENEPVHPQIVAENGLTAPTSDTCTKPA